MKKSINLFTILFCIFIASRMVSAQTSERLTGEWINANPKTRGVTSVVVANDSFGWNVEAWGKCHPTDCQWGRTKLTPMGDSVEDDSFERGFAIWNAGFADKYVEFSVKGDVLRVEVVTIFKDRSRRSSFRTVEYFRRSDPRTQ